MKRIRILKILAGIYIVFLASIIALSDIKETQYLFKTIRRIPFADKFGHLILMGLFALVLNVLLNFRQIQVWKSYSFLGSLIVLVLITIEEVSQIFVPNRDFDLMDLLTNYLGVFLFGILAGRIHKKLLD